MTTAKTTPAKAAATPAADTVKQIEEAVAVHKESIETVVKAGADVASKSVDKAVSISKDNVQAALKAGNVAFSSYEDVLLFSKENVEALVKSSSIFARGFQDISKTFAALAQEQIEESVSVGKALMGAKSFKDVVDLSTSISKSSFDKLVAEGAKLTELSSKLAEEALAPINGRVEAAVGRLTKVAA